MLKYILPSCLVIGLLAIGSCKKETYSFGDIKAPTDLTLTTTVAGVDASNPDGDGSGAVTIAASSKNALSYTIDFGDGTTRVVPTGSVNYKFTTPGTSTYTVTVNAVGTGGAISTISKKVKVFVRFEIPQAIITALTGGSSRTFVNDKNAPGHFGVGPVDGFTPSWYAAAPNTRQPCAYDDEITFSVDANKNISMTIDNKGESFATKAATGVYGFSGDDGCYAINTGGTRKLAFMAATSGSTSAVSTGIQFVVPGNGIINFGTGGNTYEILKYTDNTIFLRNVGTDGNAWYQQFIVK